MYVSENDDLDIEMLACFAWSAKENCPFNFIRCVKCQVKFISIFWLRKQPRMCVFLFEDEKLPEHHRHTNEEPLVLERQSWKRTWFGQERTHKNMKERDLIED